MRSVKKYIVLAFSMFMLLSCEDFLVTEPSDKVFLDNYFENIYDLDNASRGMYDGLQNCVEKMFVWGEVRGDLVWPASGASWEIEELNDLNVSSWNKFTDWSEFYKVINSANYVIKYASQVKEKDYRFTDKEEAQFVAEAINVRALAYFWLVRTFGDVPLILEPVDDSYLNSRTDTVWKEDGSFSVQEFPSYIVDPTYSEVILDTLEAQLKRVEGIERTYALEYSDDNTRNPAIYSSRFKAITNLALQADIKLWRGKFSEALILTERVLNYNPETYSIGDNSGAPVCFGSDLAPINRWIEIFMGDGSLSPETIFEIRFQNSTPDLNVLQEYTASKPEDGGKYIVKPSDKAINNWWLDRYYNKKASFMMDTCDIMRGYNASFAGEYDTINEKWIDPYIFKFLVNGTEGFTRNSFESDCNWIIYRMSDILCMNCEAMNRAGDYLPSIKKLQGSWGWSNVENYGLRNRVLLEEYIKSTDASPTSATEGESIILEERGKELAFEGKRWFDLIRIAQRRGQFEFFLEEMEMSAPISKKAMIKERAADPKNWFLPYNDDAKKFFVNPDYKNKTIENIKTKLGI